MYKNTLLTKIGVTLLVYNENTCSVFSLNCPC